MNDELQFDPDKLLEKTGASFLTPAVMVSLIAHIVIIGGTSFGLYRDWAQYGVMCEEHALHTPSIINMHRNTERKAKEDAERKAKLEREADERVRKEAEAATNAPPKKASAEIPVRENSNASVTPPEIEPLAPAKPGEISLDALGL